MTHDQIIKNELYMQDLPIGVFDSGVGGVTVLKALLEYLPNEDFIYLGDTARLPYGTKDHGTLVSYTLHACQELVSRGIKLLVVACNTISAHAVPILRQAFPLLPIVEVITPTVSQVCEISQGGPILVLATESTVRSGRFASLIQGQKPDVEVYEQSATVLVTLAEEGWGDNEVAESAVRRYISTYFNEESVTPEIIILGCTHFPLLQVTIEKIVGERTKIIDSAYPTAKAAKKILEQKGLLRNASLSPAPSRQQLQILVTDLPMRFERVLRHFLGAPLPSFTLEKINLSN